MLVLYQCLALACLVSILKLWEAKAPMRGMNTQKHSDFFNRFLRVVTLICLILPTCYTLDAMFNIHILKTIAAVYLISFIDLSELKGGRRNLWARQFPLFAWLVNRLHIEVTADYVLQPERNYIFALHPHGILPFGGLLGMCYNFPKGFATLFPFIQFRILAASFCFYIPLFRDIMLAFGAVDAARFSARYVLEECKESLCLVPGGATEALFAFPDRDILYLKKRTGFIRLALECGIPIVPVFSFNENNTYNLLQSTYPLINWIQKSFQKIFGLSLPLITNIIPKPTRVTVVVGEPVIIPKIEECDEKTVEKYLKIYINAVEKLYEKHSSELNIPSTKPPLRIL